MQLIVLAERRADVINRQSITRPYIWLTIALGALAFSVSAYRLPFNRLDWRFCLLALVTVGLTSRISIDIPRLSSAITVSDTFVFLILLLYGPEAAVLVASVEAISSTFRISRKPRTIFFNAGVLALATFLTGEVWRYHFGRGSASMPLSLDYVVTLCSMVFVQYIANSGLVALYEALIRDRPILQTWRRHYLWTSITYVAGASAAVITARFIESVGFYAVLVTTPIIGIIFFTYRVYLQNVRTAEAQAQQARLHIEELSSYIAEQDRIREQFSHVEKMSALGQLASGVAHDFNNSLAGILARAELMYKNTDDPRLKQNLDLIIKSAQDGAQTVKRIQDFARQRRAHDFEEIDVDQMLADVSEITRPRWKDLAEAANIHIALKLNNRSHVIVMGDVSELRDVLVNMVFNAVSAMPQGGELTLSAHDDGGENLIISVADSGIGMTPEVRSRVFDPFFTTKGVEGMGLGLAVSYGTIKRHEGTIHVESEVGRGTNFRITLPISRRAVENQKGQLAIFRKHQPEKKMTKILVIDDEDRVRRVLRDILEDGGCEVTLAAGGAEGLAIFSIDQFDAVFTDIGMPGMSGWEVVRAIREQSRELPVAVITGWGEVVSDDDRQAADVDWMLTKPFTLSQISSLIAEVSMVKSSRTRQIA